MPTVHLASYLRPDHIEWDLDAADKPGVLRALAAFAASHVPEAREEVIHDLVLKREEDTSTGVGGGLALPHAMVPGLDRTLLFFVRLRRPVEYDALDGDPVDLLVFLLSGPEALRLHVRLLARISFDQFAYRRHHRPPLRRRRRPA